MNDYTSLDCEKNSAAEPVRVPNESNEQPAAPTVKALWRTATKIGAVLCGYIVLYIGLSFVFKKFIAPFIRDNVAMGLQSSVAEIVSNVLLFLVILPILFFLARIKTTMPLFKKPTLPAKQVAKIIIIAMSAAYLATYVSSFLVNIIESFGKQLHPIDSAVELTPLGILAFIVPVLFFAPIMEETFFRGGVLSNLQKFGGWFACISVGVIFGFAHMNYPQILMAATMGTFAAFLTLKSHSIYPAMILHFSMNLIASIATILMACLPKGFAENTNQTLSFLQDGNIGALVAMLLMSVLSIGMFVIIILGIVFFVKEQKRNHAFWCFENGPAVSTTNKMFAFITSPTIILYFICTVTISIANALS